MNMSSQPTSSARIVASAALNKFDQVRKNRGKRPGSEQNYAGAILNEFLQQTKEKQRATDLVFGTIRNRLVIDVVLAGIADCPVKRISPRLVNIIRIGVYELIYRPETPVYSIINDAVENVKRTAGKKQAGFVNALLRKVASKITNRKVPLLRADVRKVLPQNLRFGCEFNKGFLPDRGNLPCDYFSTAFSLPKWLVAKWLDEFGIDKTQQICFASNRRPSVYIRPNTLKTNTYNLAEAFSQVEVNFEISTDELMIKIKGSRSVTGLPGFEEGLFTIQDLTASQPVRVLGPQPDWKILDMCTAPGIKTTQLAEMTGDKAMIIATDINSKRLERLKKNIDRLGIRSVNIVSYDHLEETAEKTGLFDAVLLDVPCSNTGVLAKRLEVRYRIKADTLKKLKGIQLDLFRTAATLIKSSGRICYSTCSIQTEENNQVVADFLAEHPGFKLESELLVLPSAEEFDHDGGYCAIVIKK